MIAVTPLQLVELTDSLGLAIGPPGQRSCNADFSRSETSHLMRIAGVLDQAQRLFGDRNRGVLWMKHQNRVLGFKTPLEQLETRAGTRRVLALLHRLEGGEFA